MGLHGLLEETSDCIFTSLHTTIHSSFVKKKHSTIQVRPSLNMLKLLVVFTVCCFASRKRSDTDFLLNQLMIVFLDPVSSVVGSDDGAMYCNYDKAGNRARELWAWMDATEIAPSSEFVASQSHCCQSCKKKILLRTRDIIRDR